MKVHIASSIIAVRLRYCGYFASLRILWIVIM